MPSSPVSFFKKAKLLIFFLVPFCAYSAPVKNAIFVNKKKNEMELVSVKEDGFDTIKKYHVTLGQVVGDKETEGDLKTPEGIYFITTKLFKHQLKAKFGDLALYLNYPNPFDKMAGKTGFDIMIHATDTPERLAKNFDSEGCIVLSNEDIRELEKQVSVKTTPVMIFEDLTPEYRNPSSNVEYSKLKSFFDSWMASWEGKEIEKYISYYHSEFQSDGKNVKAWKNYKASLNRKYDKISVAPYNRRIFMHPKYSVITFEQNYQSFFKNGKSAFLSRGTKILYVAQEEGQYKIIAEEFTRL